MLYKYGKRMCKFWGRVYFYFILLSPNVGAFLINKNSYSTNARWI